MDATTRKLIESFKGIGLSERAAYISATDDTTTAGYEAYVKEKSAPQSSAAASASGSGSARLSEARTSGASYDLELNEVGIVTWPTGSTPKTAKAAKTAAAARPVELRERNVTLDDIDTAIKRLRNSR